tara:strand:+ start:60 stop:602 length:543 start_codon:yes stop_codon:yes gene_type:complete
MKKKTIIYFIFCLAFIHAGQISLSISENLINEYLKTIGEYKTSKKKGNDSKWIIQEPHVEFNNNEALFFAKVIYKKDLIIIKKDIKLILKIKYNIKKNTLNLIFDNSIIKMERRGVFLDSIDLKNIYEPKLIFNGPNLKNNNFKINLNNKRKISIRPDFAEIFIENDKIELILTISFEEK